MQNLWPSAVRERELLKTVQRFKDDFIMCPKQARDWIAESSPCVKCWLYLSCKTTERKLWCLCRKCSIICDMKRIFMSPSPPSQKIQRFRCVFISLGSWETMLIKTYLCLKERCIWYSFKKTVSVRWVLGRLTPLCSLVQFPVAYWSFSGIVYRTLCV